MAVLCLFPNTPWPWPTPSRAASAGCGKSGLQASRRPEEANTRSCTELFPSPCARQERRSSAGLVTLLGAERGELRWLWFCRKGFTRGGGGGETRTTGARTAADSQPQLVLTVGRCGEVGLPAEVGGGGPKGPETGRSLPPVRQCASNPLYVKTCYHVSTLGAMRTWIWSSLTSPKMTM